MKNICIKALIVLCILIVFDIIEGFVCNSIYDKLANEGCCRDGFASKKNYGLNVVSCDLLITGSSPAAEAFDSKLIEDSMSSYLGKSFCVANMSFALQRIPWNYCSIMSLLDRRPPKVIIMDINATSFNKMESTGNLSTIRDFYYRNKYVKEVLDEYDNPRERFLYKWSSLYRFRSSVFQLPIQFFQKKVKDGYVPKDPVMDPSEIGNASVRDSIEADTTMVKYFYKIADSCKAHNVQLVVSLSPKLILSDKESASYKLLVSMCNKKRVPIIDMENDKRFSDYHLYYDRSHLNREGSIIYSSIISNYIKDYLTPLSGESICQ